MGLEIGRHARSQVSCPPKEALLPSPQAGLLTPTEQATQGGRAKQAVWRLEQPCSHPHPTPLLNVPWCMLNFMRLQVKLIKFKMRFSN